MKKVFLSAALAAILLSACSASHKTVKDSPTGAAHSSKQDGLSFETAIVITETHERTGVDAEYAWIRNTYPGAGSKSQKLVYHNNVPFDVLSVVMADGSQKDIYFNISNFYGKL